MRHPARRQILQHRPGLLGEPASLVCVALVLATAAVLARIVAAW